MSATMMSSSNPRQNPWGELNCPLLGPNWPNLLRICIGLTLFERVWVPLGFVVGAGRILDMGSDIMSSGVESKGDVEEDTPPNPLIKVLVMLRDEGDVERTIIVPLVIGLSTSKRDTLEFEHKVH